MSENSETKTIIENHKIITMEHDLRNEGYYLSDKKQMTLIEGAESENGGSKMMTLIHTRSIDDRCFKVTEHFPNGYNKSKEVKNQVMRTVETEMSEDEIEKFEVDWELYWKPEINKKGIANLHQRFCLK